VAKDAATRAQAAAAASDLGGGDTVQIGAFSSPALADKAWTAIAKLDPAAMAGKGKKVEAFTKEDGESLYRTYITGFSDRTMAEGFCAQLQADGKTCLVK
jgi:hypothetical protein